MSDGYIHVSGPSSKEFVTPSGAVAMDDQGVFKLVPLPPAYDADAPTITLDWGIPVHVLTLAGDRTIAFANDLDGGRLTVVFKNGDGKSWTPVWPAGVHWPGGSAPGLSGTVGWYDVVTLYRLAAGEYLGFVSATLE